MTPVRLLTSSEVAALFSVTRPTVALWARQGLLACVRTPGGRPRFTAEVVREALQGRRNDAA